MLEQLYTLKIFLVELLVREAGVVSLIGADLVLAGSPAAAPTMPDPSGDHLEDCGHFEPLRRMRLLRQNR